MISIDVEAQPVRAESEPLERLIWGRFREGSCGIGELMTAAERNGVKLTMYLDYAEEHLYGEALLDVGREISRRGHDLELHLHQQFFHNTFYSDAGVGRVHDLNLTAPDAAPVLASFISTAHQKVTGALPLAFRGGGYRFCDTVLRALGAHGVQLDSSYNACRSTCPIELGPLRQFRWSNGIFEVPVSNVLGFSNPSNYLDYNFNAGALWGKSVKDSVARHLKYLDAFYAAHGEDAIAVLVMHSWSLLRLNERGQYVFAGEGGLERFEALLQALPKKGISVVSSPEVLALLRSGQVSCGSEQDLEQAQALRRGAQAAPPSPVSQASCETTKSTPAVPSTEALGLACQICGTPIGAFEDFNGKRRRCSGCGALERQRALAHLYRLRDSGPPSLAGKRVLHIAPSVSESRFLKGVGITDLVTADVRPELNPDLVVDVCSMPEVPSSSFDAVVASYVLTCVHSMTAALSELARILRPGGVLLTSDPVEKGRATQEYTDEARVTGWYGKDAFTKYRVGAFRSLGELNLTEPFKRHFECQTFHVKDISTEAESIWCVSHKRLPQERTISRPQVVLDPANDHGLNEPTRYCYWDNIKKEFVKFVELDAAQRVELPVASISPSFSLIKWKVQVRDGKRWVDSVPYRELNVDQENALGIRYRYYPNAQARHLVVVLQAMDTRPTINYVGTLAGLNASRLYIKDDYGDDPGTRSSYYLGKGRTFDVAQKTQQLIRDALLDLNLPASSMTIAGSSKGGFAAIYHGFALHAGYVVAGGPQVLLGDFLNSRSPTSLHPPILRYLAGDTSEDSVRWANNVLFEQLRKAGHPYPSLRVHVGKGEPHYRAHVLPLTEWLVENDLPQPILDLADYAEHNGLTEHFPRYLRAEIERILRESSPS